MGCGASSPNVAEQNAPASPKPVAGGNKLDSASDARTINKDERSAVQVEQVKVQENTDSGDRSPRDLAAKATSSEGHSAIDNDRNPNSVDRSTANQGAGSAMEGTTSSHGNTEAGAPADGPSLPGQDGEVSTGDGDQDKDDNHSGANATAGTATAPEQGSDGEQGDAVTTMAVGLDVAAAGDEPAEAQGDAEGADGSESQGDGSGDGPGNATGDDQTTESETGAAGGEAEDAGTSAGVVDDDLAAAEVTEQGGQDKEEEIVGEGEEVEEEVGEGEEVEEEVGEEEGVEKEEEVQEEEEVEEEVEEEEEEEEGGQDGEPEDEEENEEVTAEEADRLLKAAQQSMASGDRSKKGRRAIRRAVQYLRKVPREQLNEAQRLFLESRESFVNLEQAAKRAQEQRRKQEEMLQSRKEQPSKWGEVKVQKSRHLHRGSDGATGELVTGAAAHRDVQDVRRAFEERARAAQSSRRRSTKGGRRGLTSARTAGPGELRRMATAAPATDSGSSDLGGGGAGADAGALLPAVGAAGSSEAAPPKLRRSKTEGRAMMGGKLADGVRSSSGGIAAEAASGRAKPKPKPKEDKGKKPSAGKEEGTAAEAEESDPQQVAKPKGAGAGAGAGGAVASGKPTGKPTGKPKGKASAGK